jgi:hypothetical protein
MKTAADVMSFIKNAQVSDQLLLEEIASHGVNNILNLDLDESEADEVANAAAEKIGVLNNIARTMRVTRRNTMKTTYHKDGTVTYWSVFQQQWIRHSDSVSDQELAAMSAAERAKVLKHLGQAA